MLPSSGYFKTLPCPFFSENEQCSRPFCHYKHEIKTVPKSEKKIKLEGKIHTFLSEVGRITYLVLTFIDLYPF